MSKMVEELEQDLEKKQGQLDRAQEKLNVKKRRNQRLRERRVKYSELIGKSEKQIEEYEKLIAWHKDQIKNWREKYDGVPGDVDFESELTKRDRIKGEFDEMEALLWRIKEAFKSIETEDSEFIKEVYEEDIKKFAKKFKSAKGHGF